MTPSSRLSMSCVLLAAAQGASAAIVYTSQERQLTVVTQADMGMDSRAATDFAPFVSVLDLDTTFLDINQEVRRNRGRGSISCFLEFNSIAATGDLLGQGGIRAGPLGPEPVFGGAEFRLDVRFTLTEASSFQLIGFNIDQRNSPDDYFDLRLSPENGADVFRFDEFNPVDNVNMPGELPAGNYRFRYRVQTTSAGDAASGGYDLRLLIPAPGTVGVLAAGLTLAGRRRRRV
jgi:hypothetical protein